MTETYIKIDRRDVQHMDKSYYNNFTQESRYIQLYPGDTHAKWGEIIDAWPAGIKLRITRVQNNLSCSGARHKLGSIHFIPMSKVSFVFASKEDAEGRSLRGHGPNDNVTWQEFQNQAKGI